VFVSQIAYIWEKNEIIMAFAVQFCDMIHCSYEMCHNKLKRGVAQGGTAPAAAGQADAGDACARTPQRFAP